MGPPFNFFDILQQIGCLKIPMGPPFNFFDISQQIGCLKIPKGPPFQFCGIVRFFSKTPFNCYKNVDNLGSVPLLARQGLALAGPGAPLGPFFSIFEYCKSTLGSPFAIFEPWIWRRLGPVPACLVKLRKSKVRNSQLQFLFVVQFPMNLTRFSWFFF